MNKEQVLDRLQRDWKTFLASFEGLPVSALLEPNVVGWWSVRDVLAHITTWDEEKLKILPLLLEGKLLHRRYSSFNAFNAQEQERKRYLSLDQVKQELAATHEKLVASLAGFPENAYTKGKRLPRSLRLTWNHYQEHATQITAWRTERKL